MAFVSDRLLGIEKPAHFNWLKRYLEQRRVQRKLAKAEAELRALDDRMLADIGVVRSDIRNAVRTRHRSRWR